MSQERARAAAFQVQWAARRCIPSPRPARGSLLSDLTRPPPAFLTADLLAATASAAGVARFAGEALAHGRALVARLRALGGAPGAPPSAAEVLAGLDEVQLVLRTVKGVGQLAADVHPDAGAREAGRTAVSDADALETELHLDAALAAVVKAVAARAPAGTLDGPSARLLDHLLAKLRRNGLDLPPEGQAELRRLNAEISHAGQEFEKNLAEAEGRIEIPPSSLEGLPAEYVAAKMDHALPSGNVVVTTDYPDLFPFIRYARDRRAARALYAELDSRAAAANVPLLERLLALRERKARLLGYDTWADYAIEPRMAGSAAAVRAFLATVRDAVRAPAEAELAELRAAHVRAGGRPDDPLYPPDRYFLEEQVRAQKHGYDSRELAAYFEVGAVKDGLLALTARLYGLEYRRAAAPPWHADVEAYEVLAGGARLGTLVLDLYPRPGKFKHAGAFEVRPAWRAGGATPIAALVCNLPRPEPGHPALLGHDDVVILFHEFGHLMHQLLSESPYATFAGEAVARDFLETPSQVFEEWAFQREALDLFARHHQTGAPIPAALHAALLRARRLGLAVATQVQLFLAALDIEYHSLPTGFDSTRVMREIFAAYQPFAFIEGTHYQATFAHLIGYDAAYYGYQWSLALTCDVLTRFRAGGFLSPELAARWRSAVLARGGSEDEARLVERFLERPPSTAAYIEYLSGG
jgi:thimet oligopeptidase